MTETLAERIRAARQGDRPAFRYDAADELVQAATMGFSDEAGAGVTALLDALVSGDNLSHAYDRNLEGIRGAREQWLDESGGLGPVMANILGSLVPGAVAGRTGGVLRGIGAGAAAGATGGFGASEGGIENRGAGALAGGMVGAGIGTAIPAITGTAGYIGRTGLRMGNPEAAAGRLMVEALSRDRMTPADLSAAVQRMGPDATPMDASESLLRRGRGTQAIPSEGGRMVGDFLAGRSANRVDRLLDEMRDVFGDTDAYETLRGLRDLRAREATPLYEMAMQAEPVPVRQLGDLINSPTFRRAYQRAQRMWSDAMRLSPAERESQFPGLRFNDQLGWPETLNPGSNQSLDWEQLHLIKLSMDDLVQRASRGASSAGRNEFRTMVGLSRDFRNLLDDENLGNPAYRAAREAWGGPSEAIGAIEDGRRFLRGDVEEMAEQYSELTPINREFFRLGVARELSGRLEMRADPASWLSRNRSIRNRLETIFENPDQMQSYLDAVETQARMARTENVVLGGSPTARIDQEVADITRGPGDELVEALMQGGTRPGRAALGAIGGAAARRIFQPSMSREAVVDALGPMLLEQPGGGALVQALIDAIARQSAQGAARTGAIVSGAGALGRMTGQQ